MEKNVHVIIFEKFQPPTLFDIKLSMREHILQALGITVDIHMNILQIVVPYLQGEYNSSQLEAMGWIIFLIHLQLSGGISYNLVILH